mgnify:FL=1
MKTIVSDDRIIVYLNNKTYYNLDNLDLDSFFMDIISKIQDDYEEYLYNSVNVYKDINYGLILEFISEDNFYFDLVDMKANIFKIDYFLYKIDYLYLDEEILKNCDLYKNGSNIYLKIKNDINYKKYIELLEISDIIYGESVLEVLKHSKKVDYEKESCGISRTT